MLFSATRFFFFYLGIMVGGGGGGGGEYGGYGPGFVSLESAILSVHRTGFATKER